MKYLIYILMLLLLMACTDDTPNLTENNPRIHEELMQRRQAYYKRKMNECRAEVIDRATVYVDSLISARISFQFSDSIVFPPKPEKPETKNPIIIEDTVRARPLNLK